jgi:hypothetical protein
MGMDNVGSTVYGLMDPASASSFEGACSAGCVLQSIDVAERIVNTQATYHLDMSQVNALHFDAVSGRVLIAYRKAGDDFFDSPYPGYRVELLDL